MWKKSENSNNIKPTELEKIGNIIIVRKNFVLVEATDEVPEHWSYLEWQMTSDQYDIYKIMTEQSDLQESAILELADLIGGLL